jgi:hypothetical protein
LIKLDKYFFFRVFEVNKIGYEPSGVVAAAVEPRHFEIPVLYLEDVEFDAFYMVKLQIALFDFIEKQGQIVGLVII